MSDPQRQAKPTPRGEGIAGAETYLDVADSPEFEALRRTFRRFVFPMSALFLVWYLVYVLLSNYAGDFMATEVIGNIHLGLIIGLLQFVSTFVITMVYARWADKRFDPAAEQLARRVHVEAPSNPRAGEVTR